MMKWRTLLGLTALVLAFSLPLSGCKKEEDLGDKIEDAVDDIGDAVDDIGDEID